MNKKGFTMNEVIIATLLIAILAAGAFSAFSGTERFINRARHRIQAFNFAMETLDRLKANNKYGGSAMAIGANHPETDIVGIGNTIIQGEISALNPALTYDITEPQVNGYKEVTVKFHWNEPTL